MQKYRTYFKFYLTQVAALRAVIPNAVKNQLLSRVRYKASIL